MLLVHCYCVNIYTLLLHTHFNDLFIDTIVCLCVLWKSRYAHVIQLFGN